MNKKLKIVVENSAPSQGKPAKSVAWASEILKNLGVTRLVDIGCGRLRNLATLRRFFSDITLVDTKLQCGRIENLLPKSSRIKLLDNEQFKNSRQKFNAAFLISILHVIPDLASRNALLSLAINKTYKSGYIVIDVPSGERYYRQKCTPKNKYRDGWLMGNGTTRTFYKNYTATELDAFLTNDNPLELFRKVWFDKHIVRIMKKAH